MTSLTARPSVDAVGVRTYQHKLIYYDGLKTNPKKNVGNCTTWHKIHRKPATSMATLSLEKLSSN